jgi:hypothetical protein
MGLLLVCISPFSYTNTKISHFWFEFLTSTITARKCKFFNFMRGRNLLQVFVYSTVRLLNTLHKNFEITLHKNFKITKHQLSLGCCPKHFFSCLFQAVLVDSDVLLNMENTEEMGAVVGEVVFA